MNSMFEILANNAVKTSWLARYLKEYNKETIETEEGLVANPLHIEGHLATEIVMCCCWEKSIF